MKVRFVQSGGYGGLVKEWGLDTANLAAEEARTVEELVRNSGLSTSGAHFSATGRDLHQYDITIDDGAGLTEATHDDETIPASARPLVAYLRRQARPARAPS